MKLLKLVIYGTFSLKAEKNSGSGLKRSKGKVFIKIIQNQNIMET